MVKVAQRRVVINQVRDFVDKASGLGKYPKNTAMAMSSALKVIEEGLKAEEPDTIDYMMDHLEEIFTRQKLDLSPRSFETYLARARRALSDFKKFGQNPKDLYSWKPKTRRVRYPRTSPVENAAGSDNPTVHAVPVLSTPGVKLRTLVWSLRPDLAVQIQLPFDLSKSDVARLKKLLDLEAELTP